MAGLVLAPGETNISRIAQIIRQLMAGKSNAIGKVTLNTGNGGVTALGSFTPGTNYTPGFYPSQPLTGGFGSGATADITVNGSGSISAVVLVSPGTGYHAGDVLSAGIPGAGFAGGPIASISLISGGFGYSAAGSYPNRPFTGGSGSGATGDFVIAGNVVASVVLNNPGNSYQVGDTLSVSPASVGGSGAAFFAQVTGVSGSGFGVTVVSVAGGTRTVVEAPNCSTTSIIDFHPMTLHAAAIVTGVYVAEVDIEKGQFTITHPNTPNSDCIFSWETRG